MEKGELEKTVYLYLCGARDRELLMEKREMKYYDFRRLLFLIGYIRFEDYAASFWNQFSGNFIKNIEALEAILDEESARGVFYEDVEFVFWEEEKWIEEFTKNVPKDIRRWVKEYVDSLEPERGEMKEIFRNREKRGHIW